MSAMSDDGRAARRGEAAARERSAMVAPPIAAETKRNDAVRGFCEVVCAAHIRLALVLTGLADLRVESRGNESEVALKGMSQDCAVRSRARRDGAA